MSYVVYKLVFPNNKVYKGIASKNSLRYNILVLDVVTNTSVVYRGISEFCLFSGIKSQSAYKHIYRNSKLLTHRYKLTFIPIK